MAADLGCPLIGVQHHHAHAAAVLAENQFNEPALAIVCDGAGFAGDGSIWGGELLRVDLTGFTRLGHLRYMPLAGGDACAKYPWRSALSLLHAAFDSGFADLPICQELANADELRDGGPDVAQQRLLCIQQFGGPRLRWRGRIIGFVPT